MGDRPATNVDELEINFMIDDLGCYVKFRQPGIGNIRSRTVVLEDLDINLIMV